MEVDRETSRLDFCNYCLIRDRGLTKYSLDQSPSLKSILQVEDLLFCYICTKFAKNAEEFIQKVGNAQQMFKVFGVVDTYTLEQQMQPRRYLNEQFSDPIQISPEDTESCTENFDDGNYKTYSCGGRGRVEEAQFKVEIKMENMLQNNDDDDNDVGDYNELPDVGFDMKDNLSLLMVKQELVGEEMDPRVLAKRVKRASRRRKGKHKTKKDKIRKEEEVKVKKEPRPSSQRYDTHYVERVSLSGAALARERAALAAGAQYAGAPLQCAECVKGFTAQSSYEQHMKKHSPSHGHYECKICKIRKKSEYLLECHMKYHRVRYRCKICNVTRVNRRTVRDHYSACHDTETVHKCAHCAKIYKSSRSLRAHTWYAHTHASDARATCDHCQRTFATKSSLQTHLMLKHGQTSPAGARRTHACGACGKRFLVPSLLRKHMLAHTDRRDYYCVECDKSFKSEQSLNHHLTTTTSHVTNKELRYACTQCEKRFPNRRDQEHHLNKYHLHVKPHQCDKCDRAYVSKWSLRNHTRLAHEGYKLPRKYPCQMCDKVFDRNQILIAHIRTHTGERPYQCQQCSASFAQRNVLHTHTRLVHLKQTRNGRAKLTREAGVENGCGIFVDK